MADRWLDRLVAVTGATALLTMTLILSALVFALASLIFGGGCDG